MKTFKDSYKKECRTFHTHGTGDVEISKISKKGTNIVIEKDVRIFHPENIELSNNIYVGHGVFLKAYYKNKLIIGSNVWIGQGAFLHAGGGIEIAEAVGIGPFVKILTLEHTEEDRETPVLYNEQNYKKVIIEYGVDLGIASIILPGITVGRQSIIGAGAVVTKDIPAFSVAVGVPARVIRQR